jgi:hypothetical protein
MQSISAKAPAALMCDQGELAVKGVKGHAPRLRRPAQSRITRRA